MSTIAIKEKVPPSSPSLEREGLKGKCDSELALAHIAGNEYAFTELVRRYEKRLMRFAFRRTWDMTETEDIVQTAFLRVAKHIKSYDPERKFSTWVYEITKNLCLNTIRNRCLYDVRPFSRIGQEEMQAIEGRTVSSSSFGLPDEIFRKKNRDEEIRRAVDDLPVHQRTPIQLWMKGSTYEEIAQKMGINIGTVKSRLHRARATRLARALSHLDHNK